MFSFFKMFTAFLGVGLAASFLSSFFLGRLPIFQAKAEVTINNHVIIADVAETDFELDKGLGGRKSIASNGGMLFLFKRPDTYEFWMKDMEFPIDIIWIATSTVVGITPRVYPEPGVALEDLALYVPPEPVTRVLEVDAGEAELMGIRVGDVVSTRAIHTRPLHQ